MTWTMVKKSLFRYPPERYLNIIKKGYKDCKLDFKYLKSDLINNWLNIFVIINFNINSRIEWIKRALNFLMEI